MAPNWSFLDRVSPEVFSFGFDPEVVTSLWGLVRSPDSSLLSPPAASQVPNAPFQILVPLHHVEGTTLLSLVQCTIATTGVLVVITLGSYTAYKMIHAARTKYLKGSEAEQKLLSRISSNDLNDRSDSRSSSVEAGVQQPPVRPNSLTVVSKLERMSGIKQSAEHFLSVAKLPGLSNLRKNPKVERELEFDFDDIEDLSDIETEYFGPELTAEDSLDDQDFRTPCA